MDDAPQSRAPAPAPSPVANTGDGVPSLAHRAGRSARWAVLQSGGKHFIDLAVFLILAKLLAPEAFGLVAMASSVIVLMNVASEMGLGDAIVQRQDLQPEHLDSAFWATAFAGLVLMLGVALAAPLIVALFGRQDLTPILRALTPLFLIQALNVVPQAVLQREFGFHKLALRALIGSVLGGVIGVGMAMNGGGAWSLVVQQLVAGGVGLVGLWLSSPWKPRWRFSKRHGRELLDFGRSVLGARLLNVAASKADTIIIGIFLGPVLLGYYSVAARMLLALEQLFCQGVDAVALSAYSRVGQRPDDMRRLYLASTLTAAVLALPVFGGLALLAPELIAAVIGARWAGSGPVLQLLALAGLVQAVMHFNHAVFKASNRPELSMRVAIISTSFNLLSLAIAVHFGILAVAFSYLLRCALIAPVGLVLAGRLMDLRWADYFRPLLQPVLALLAGGAVAALLRHTLAPVLPVGLLLLVCAAGGLPVYLGWLWVFAKGPLPLKLPTRR